MRHAVYGRQFSRTKDERHRLFTSLVRSVFIFGGIKTTVAKAKSVQPIVEKLVTHAISGKDTDIRMIIRVICDRTIACELATEAKTRFAARTSGFTRIIRLGRRLGDSSEMARLEFVDPRIAKKPFPVKLEKTKEKAPVTPDDKKKQKPRVKNK